MGGGVGVVGGGLIRVCAHRPAARAGDRLAEALTAVLEPDVELGGRLSNEGSAVLYAGRDRHRDVAVVVKACRDSAAESLQTEARALARLAGHPHILGAVSVGHRGDLTWVVTDRAPGGSLQDRIGTPADQALRWAAQLACALDHAHTNGVVHGDVTPSNVLVGAQDQVLLGDFGSAVVLEDAALHERPRGATPAFAPPERHRRVAATASDDVYGLGATMVTVCGDIEGLPAVQRRLLQRCLGPARRRPDARQLANGLTL